jgi:hypothetical protein
MKTTKGYGMKIPAKLYHGAPECVAGKIFEDGLVPNFGEIYASDSPAGCISFMWFRLLDHIHPELVDGKPKLNIEQHDGMHVWEIDTSMTDITAWEHGTDHARGAFGGATSWVYTGGTITASAIKGFTYTREMIEDAVHASRS